MQMNDAHIYCSKESFKEEFLNVRQMYLDYFEIFGIEKYSMRLSLHNKEALGENIMNLNFGLRQNNGSESAD